MRNSISSFFIIARTHGKTAHEVCDTIAPQTKKRSREKMEAEARTTAEQGESEGEETKLLWRIVTDHPDIFDTHSDEAEQERREVLLRSQ